MNLNFIIENENIAKTLFVNLVGSEIKEIRLNRALDGIFTYIIDDGSHNHVLILDSKKYEGDLLSKNKASKAKLKIRFKYEVKLETTILAPEA